MLHISISAEPLIHLGKFTINNSLLTTWLSMAIIALIVWLGTRKIKIKPETNLQILWEVIIEFFEDLISTMVDTKKTKVFFPIVTTFFIFILTMNWIGLVPGVGTIGLNKSNTKQEIIKDASPGQFIKNHAQDADVLKSIPEKEKTEFIPLLRAGTADLNTTLALSIIVMSLVQYYGLKYLGLKNYLHKFINFSNPIQFFVGILEIISEFAKIISFAFRLFGNIFAGEVLLAVTLFLIPVVLPIPFLGLEIFVGLIQAFVFSMLSVVFLSIATEKHEL